MDSLITGDVAMFSVGEVEKIFQELSKIDLDLVVQSHFRSFPQIFMASAAVANSTIPKPQLMFEGKMIR